MSFSDYLLCFIFYGKFTLIGIDGTFRPLSDAFWAVIIPKLLFHFSLLQNFIKMLE